MRAKQLRAFQELLARSGREIWLPLTACAPYHSVAVETITEPNMTKPATKMTINEIARLAGVSTGTVSRVLNNREDVSANTRAAVLDIVKQTGFVPDNAARRLRRGSQQLVGIANVDGALRRPFFSCLQDAIQEAFFQNGYAVRVLDPSGDDPAAQQSVGFIVPGLHVEDSRPKWLRTRRLPFVTIGPPMPNVARVVVQDEHGVLEAMAHLIALGHRQIAHLTGPPFGQDAQRRLSAYRQGLEQAGIAFDERLVRDGNFSDMDSYRAIRGLLEAGQSFTAVVAASDEMALGAIQALADVGLRVPHDVSVIGFDDLPFSKFATPGLTTVRQPIREIGHAASQLLVEQVNGQSPRAIEIETYLVVRHSTAPRRNR
jgi:LacI family transcriptional regulator